MAGILIDDAQGERVADGACRCQVCEHFVDILRAVFIEYEHYRGYAWDFESLAAELDAAGFTTIERCELENSADPVLCGLESRVLPVDRVTMLTVEARRP